MARRDPDAAIRQMLDHAIEAREMVRGRSRDDLDADRPLNLALVRLLEIVGEAAGRVSREVQQEHPRVPWAEIISLRNRLIHGYDEVDFDIIWQIATVDLPPLIDELTRITR